MCVGVSKYGRSLYYGTEISWEEESRKGERWSLHSTCTVPFNYSIWCLASRSAPLSLLGQSCLRGLLHGRYATDVWRAHTGSMVQRSQLSFLSSVWAFGSREKSKAHAIYKIAPRLFVTYSTYVCSSYPKTLLPYVVHVPVQHTTRTDSAQRVCGGIQQSFDNLTKFWS